jgi:16S rRNA (cytosine967-C5)-methyltransferase
MRSINFSKLKSLTNGWDAAACLLTEYRESPRKANELLDKLAFASGSTERAQAQFLFLGALRHGHRTKLILSQFLKKAPRSETEAFFLIAGFELYNSPKDKHPKIVHHAVEKAKKSLSQAESRLINAVLRKLPDAFESIQSTDQAAYFSHPTWLVEQWNEQFGRDATESLLRWNQNIPSNHIEIHTKEIPTEVIPTEWPNFYRLPPGSIPETVRDLLNNGEAYIKDPSTRIAPSLLSPKPGESVLDLCAAPGGKAFDMAGSMNGRGRLLAVDLPGPRIDRLRENLSRLDSPTFKTNILECDILELNRELIPDLFDAVMLDAPCSNTGVIQRRTDVKWRLRPDDISNCTHLQSQLLHSAARFVRPGGRLLYSTCSIEASENQNIVGDFLASRSGAAFSVKAEMTSYPWESGHDGAGACLLTRNLH